MPSSLEDDVFEEDLDAALSDGLEELIDHVVPVATPTRVATAGRTREWAEDLPSVRSVSW